jgi:hypothetical protein
MKIRIDALPFGLSAGLVLALSGCPDTNMHSVSDAPNAARDAAPDLCETDRVCPELAPLGGGRCEGALTCQFPTSCGGVLQDSYACQEGRWVQTMSMCIGAPPVLAELCTMPQTTGLAGATFEVTPDLAGAAPYTDGQRVELTIGPQGGAMLPYRVRIGGVDVPPTCIQTRTRLTMEGETRMTDERLRVRCGTTMRVYDILPTCPSGARDFNFDFEITVEGIGTQTLRLVTTGGPCPRG